MSKKVKPNPNKKIPAKAVKKKLLPLVKKKPNKEIIPSEFTSVLMDVFKKDEKLVSFYIAWLKNDGNSTKAYQELHPDVDDRVASVLGSRRLAKVREVAGTDMLLCDFGLGLDTYLKKIKEGLNATNFEIIDVKIKDPLSKESKIVYEKIEIPNHAVQKAYHDKLGIILGIEGKTPNVAVQVNTNTNIIDNINDDELDDLLN